MVKPYRDLSAFFDGVAAARLNLKARRWFHDLLFKGVAKW